MKLIEEGMNLLGIGTIFGHKSSSSSSGTVSSSSSSAPASVQVPSQIFDLEPGLKALTSQSSFNRSCVNRTSLHSSSSSSSSMEMSMERKNKRTREFPPPIHLLARTENLPCHMPWVLKRCYIDGRLVLHEVPVKHHECFKAHRSNGRLVLRMMYMTDEHHSQPSQTVDDHPDVLNDDDDDEDRHINEIATPSSTNVEENLEEKDAVKSDADEDLDCQQNSSDPKQEEEVFVSPIMVEDKNLRNSSEPKQEEDEEVEEEVYVSPLIAEHKSLRNSSDTMKEAEHKSVLNGLDTGEEEEEEVCVSPPSRAEHKNMQQVEQLQRVLLHETRIYSSSMQEGRLGCSPKDGRNDFFKISTPTIRPIYS